MLTTGLNCTFSSKKCFFSAAWRDLKVLGVKCELLIKFGLKGWLEEDYENLSGNLVSMGPDPSSPVTGRSHELGKRDWRGWGWGAWAPTARCARPALLGGRVKGAYSSRTNHDALHPLQSWCAGHEGATPPTDSGAALTKALFLRKSPFYICL